MQNIAIPSGSQRYISPSPASEQAHQNDQFCEFDFLCGLFNQYGLFHGLPHFPVTGGDDFCLIRQMVHGVDPCLNSRTVRQAEIRQDAIIETGIIFQTVDIRMRPASPMVRRKRDFLEWEFTKKMNAVGL